MEFFKCTLLILVLGLVFFKPALSYEFSTKLNSKQENILKELYEGDPNKMGIIPLLSNNLKKIPLYNDYLMENFETYLKKKRNSTLDSQKEIMEILWNNMYEHLLEYDNYIGKNCMTPSSKDDNDHSWIESFIAEFGNNYIQGNVDNILIIISYLHRKVNYECGKKLKINLINDELEYYYYSKAFYSDFLLFIDDFTKKKNFTLKEIKTFKEYINNYLEILEKRSLLYLYFDFLKLYTSKAAIPKEMDEVFHYLSSIPKLQAPFSLYGVSRKIMHLANTSLKLKSDIGRVISDEIGFRILKLERDIKKEKQWYKKARAREMIKFWKDYHNKLFKHNL